MPIETIEKRPDYIHHQATSTAIIREVVFGMEDGMVSTLGAITGIAIGAQSRFIVLLSGMVIIAVESISMGVGSYLSSKSEKEVHERMLSEEKTEIHDFPKLEEKELIAMYEKDGWPKQLSEDMAAVAKKNPAIMLKEMAYRELGIIPENLENPWKNGIAMTISYVIGGAIPIVAYFFLPIARALTVSVTVTFVGLFLLGVATTRFTKRSWWKAGFEMLILAAVATGIGYAIGKIADQYLLGR